MISFKPGSRRCYGGWSNLCLWRSQEWAGAAQSAGSPWNFRPGFQMALANAKCQFIVAKHKNLVGGLEHGLYFPFHIWDVILPIDELIFFRGVGQPPTRNRCC